MSNKSKTGPIIIVGALFFILGFITWLNGILIPYLQTACELNDFQASMVMFAFYVSYTVMALPSSWILKKTGFKNGMTVGLWVMALGALVFIPAAFTRVYNYFLLGLFILGTGMAVLQTAVNPYITILGPIESAAKRISMMGIANKVAGALAPLVLAYFVIQQGDDEAIKNLVNLSPEERAQFLDGLAYRVVNPYIVMAIVLFLVGLGLKFSKLPDVDSENNEDLNESGQEDKSTVFAYPNLVLGVLALFFYVGAEVIAGDTIISYGKSLGIPLETAKNFTSYTMLAMIAGYIIGILFIPKYLSQHKALQYSAILGVVFSTAALFTEGFTSVLFIALLGLANALVWPAVWPLAIKGLGRHIKTGSAMLIMAISGGALLPVVRGALSDSIGGQLAYIVLIPAYLVILFFSVKGYKMKKW
jgi:glucose/galactose transporter